MVATIYGVERVWLFLVVVGESTYLVFRSSIVTNENQKIRWCRFDSRWNLSIEMKFLYRT